MKKLFLDSNIWLRFLTKDEPKQFTDVLKLIEKIESGNFKTYTSTLVLLEVNYVLKNLYRLPMEEVVKALESIKSVRGLTIIEKTAFSKALNLYKLYKIKLADCLIATQLPQNTLLVTYDRDFKKIKGLASRNPGELA